eukprot:GCRY01008105.1.p1 GENE.GCRY01008105.1~~GCRY01008105.1.p1  ORF type:complete len:182 (+),score=4.36 GCRY01008105.1:505-1050(+)
MRHLCAPYFQKLMFSSSTRCPYETCWGFIDGTLMQISRPTFHQKEMYNGHRGRHHGIKFQTIVTPDGIISHLFGPISGRRHDAYMLAVSGSSLTPEQIECNKKMSKVREAVEWGYGQIVRLWAFLDFRKNLKLYLSPVATYYINGAFLTNVHTILNNGNQTSSFFSISPPSLDEYLHTQEM